MLSYNLVIRSFISLGCILICRSLRDGREGRVSWTSGGGREGSPLHEVFCQGFARAPPFLRSLWTVGIVIALARLDMTWVVCALLGPADAQFPRAQKNGRKRATPKKWAHLGPVAQFFSLSPFLSPFFVWAHFLSLSPFLKTEFVESFWDLRTFRLGRRYFVRVSPLPHAP